MIVSRCEFTNLSEELYFKDQILRWKEIKLKEKWIPTRHIHKFKIYISKRKQFNTRNKNIFVKF